MIPRAASPPGAEPADPGFAALKALILGETGHYYYDDKDDQLRERIARRMAALGIADAATYRQRLEDEAAGPREWRLLESELTINETFFFRFAEQVAALRETILPALIAARGEDRRLRIWSAGCATGAEPYSLAVLLADLLGEDRAGWQLSILGTDIDETALIAAREARYGGWALRAIAPAERARLFDPDGARWRLKPVYRAMVRFERQNLLDLLGVAPLQLNGFDLILCRNTLIYFHPDLATRLVDALGERLARGGWLLLGHAEAGVASTSILVPAETGGIVAYRAPADAAMAGAAPAGPAAPVPAMPRRRPPRSRPARRATPFATPAPVSADPVAPIRALLAAGAIDAAREAIARARAAAPGDPLLHYLAGLAAAAARDPAAAERALRGAIYLDGGFAMAHYLLGEQLLAAGRAAPGRRALANAVAALATAPDEAPVPEGEGLTVADLRGAVRHRLAALADEDGR